MSYDEFMALDEDARKERYEALNLSFEYCSFQFCKIINRISEALSSTKEQP